MLLGIESKQKEEDAKANARHTEVTAEKKAKQKLEAALKAAHHREKLAQERAKKIEEEAAKLRRTNTTTTTTTTKTKTSTGRVAPPPHELTTNAEGTGAAP